MRILVVSDLHLGYDWEGPRQDESFEMARTALKLALKQNPDLILLPGDIFDTKIPKQEVWKQALSILSLPHDSNQQPANDIEVVGGSKEIDQNQMVGVPVVAIHGTHERRSKKFVNPVEILEEIGYLIHLHSDHVVLEKDTKDGKEDKVAIHGLSGVPEEYATKALQQWGPKPVDNTYNVLLLHQSIKGWVYSDPESSVLSLETLPPNFDLIIDGHIHWPDYERTEKNLMFPGSTITTQIRQTESERKKGIVALDTEQDELEFIELPRQRAVHYLKVEVGSKSAEEIVEIVRHRCQEELVEDESSNKIDTSKKPLLRLIIKDEADFRLSDLRQELEKNYLLSLSLRAKENSSSELEIAEFEESEKSIFATGLDILAKNYPAPRNQLEDLFGVLVDSDLEAALELIDELKLTTESEAKGHAPPQEEKEKKKKGSLNNYLT